jgi:hypothetical protein
MKQSKNYKKLVDVGEENITTEIEKRVSRNEWILIGGIKSWLRRCKHCGNVVQHTNHVNYSSSVRFNKKCGKCRQPTGSNNSFYGKHHTKKIKVHLSKIFSGKNNPMYGTCGGMFGKKHSEKYKKSQSSFKRLWWKKQGHVNISKFKRYRYKVDSLTRNQPIHLLENFNKRGRAGVDGAYHLDHIVSVWKGFHKKIPPEKIANIKNLRFIPWRENQKKWYK